MNITVCLNLSFQSFQVHDSHIMSMTMFVTWSKMRFVTASGKMKVPTQWFPCNFMTLPCVALKKKDKYQCSKFSGNFRIWGYWFSIYFLFWLLCTVLNRLILSTTLSHCGFVSFWALPHLVSTTAHAPNTFLSFIDSSGLWVWNELWYAKDLMCCVCVCAVCVCMLCVCCVCMLCVCAVCVCAVCVLCLCAVCVL
jgi:hypothetical protein